jgi:hypothetical protein
VIDGVEDLIVSLYTAKLSSDNYPAVCDAGPAVQGKGNIYSFNGQNWSFLYEDSKNQEDYNCNFFVAAIVSSIGSDIPDVEYNQSNRSNFSLSSVAVDLHAASLPNKIALQSVYPATFPEVTGYYIYRDNVRIATVPSVPRRYLDMKPTKETFYQVSAIFSGNEGQRSAPVSILPVSNLPVDSNEIQLNPRIFTNQVELSSYEKINRVEVYTVSGHLSLRIDKPDKIIHTESLHPGLYFFRVYLANGNHKVLKGIRK